jgi:hypothetical protein
MREAWREIASYNPHPPAEQAERYTGLREEDLEYSLCETARTLNVPPGPWVGTGLAGMMELHTGCSGEGVWVAGG